LEPDELLIKRILNGDNEAFRSIVENYQKLIYLICFNIVKDHQEAENLAQETFIKAYNSLSQYQFGGFKTWIARIGTNTAIDFKRKQNSKKEAKIIYIEDINEISIKGKPSLQDDFLEKEERERIISVCRKIPKKYGTVLIKYYIDSKSYKQISNEDGISVRTVESRLYRAKKLFKRRWNEDEHYESF